MMQWAQGRGGGGITVQPSATEVQETENYQTIIVEKGEGKEVTRVCDYIQGINSG